MIIEEITAFAKRPGRHYQWYIEGLVVPAPRRLFPDSTSLNPAFITWSHRDSDNISNAWMKVHGSRLTLPAATFPFDNEALRTDRGGINVKKITVVRDDGQFLAFKAYLAWDVGDGSCNIKLVAMPIGNVFPWNPSFKIEEALA